MLRTKDEVTVLSQAVVRTPYVGVVVKLRGLVGAAKHNAKLAAVLRHLPAKARFELELLESGQRMDVKPANFELVRLPAGTAVATAGLPFTGDPGDPWTKGVDGED